MKDRTVEEKLRDYVFRGTYVESDQSRELRALEQIASSESGGNSSGSSGANYSGGGDVWGAIAIVYFSIALVILALYVLGGILMIPVFVLGSLCNLLHWILPAVMAAYIPLYYGIVFPYLHFCSKISVRDNIFIGLTIWIIFGNWLMGASLAQLQQPMPLFLGEEKPTPLFFFGTYLVLPFLIWIGMLWIAHKNEQSDSRNQNTALS